MIRVILPAHLKTLINESRDVHLEVEGPITLRSVLDALELRHPVLTGTVRDSTSGQRRPYVRFFACESDLSHEPVDQLLPVEVASGRQPLYVVGAMAGG